MGTYTIAEAIMVPIAMIVVIAGGWLLRHFLKDKDEAIRTLPLQILAIIILLLEVLKQCYHLLWLRDWDTWDLPMHFCSFFLVWFSFALFSRGKLRQLAYSCCLCGGILVTLMILMAPRMIVSDACENIYLNFGKFHTFHFHFIVVAYWLWMLMLNLYHPHVHHIWQTTLLYFGYFCLILAAAYIFNTNYTNALRADGIAFLENIRLSAGQVVYTLVMFTVGTAAIALTATASYFAISKSKKRAN